MQDKAKTVDIKIGFQPPSERSQSHWSEKQLSNVTQYTTSVQPKIAVRIQRKGIPEKLYFQSSSPGADFAIGYAL